MSKLWIVGIGSILAIWVTLLLAACGGTSSGGGNSSEASKGEYIFRAAIACACHGPNLAGYKNGGEPELPASAPFGEIFQGPFGSIPARNITQDKATGLGNWTEDQIIQVLRTGKAPDGRMLYPIMPYNAYHSMSDEDMHNLVAYLRTLPAVSNKVPDRQLTGQVPPQPSLPAPPATAPTSGIDRGSYLVNAVGICGDCHTPQTPDGAPDTSKMLAGAPVPRAGGTFQIAPNITPDQQTGIGTWTEQQIAALLKTGTKAGGTKVKGLMAEVVQDGFSHFTDADAQAIAAYLKSIPAVSNVPQAPSSP